MTTEAPRWFRDALAHEPRRGRVRVRGAAVAYLAWGDPAAAPVLLVHGGGAHSHWWCHIAPQLARERLVVALDLSGHGDSEHRDEYPREVWAEEVFTVLEDAGARSAPVLVGHSMGGMVCVLAAESRPDAVGGLVLVETPIGVADPETAEARSRRRALRTARAYADRETAIARFRLIPPQPCVDPWVLEHVASNSVVESPRGWTWRFDPEIYRRHFPRGVAAALAGVACPFAFVRGSLSVSVSERTHRSVCELLGREVPDVVVDGAHHHVLLDHPEALVAALDEILAGWEAQ
ncbi:MAG: alpha/beta hydrolase [Acidimicrobiia bacterium]|nr:alpha/beta hydrolase [Acidimicrobiia bacterium]